LTSLQINLFVSKYILQATQYLGFTGRNWHVGKYHKARYNLHQGKPCCAVIQWLAIHNLKIWLKIKNPTAGLWKNSAPIVQLRMYTKW